MFTKLFDRVVSYMQARETERLLHSLSDASLKDIGITRGGIPELVAHAQPLRMQANDLPAPGNANQSRRPLARAA